MQQEGCASGLCAWVNRRYLRGRGGMPQGCVPRKLATGALQCNSTVTSN